MAAAVNVMITDQTMSVATLVGLVSLGGIAARNQILLIDHYLFLMREEGMPVELAVVAAGRRRFRPILLTSLTTFAGLVPMIFETSSQARFLVPMAIALGFGTLLSAPVVMVLPACLRTITTGKKRKDHVPAEAIVSTPRGG